MLHPLIRDRALVLPADDELLDELANVRLREASPGVLRMEHDDQRSPTCMLRTHFAPTSRVNDSREALGLACYRCAFAERGGAQDAHGSVFRADWPRFGSLSGATSPPVAMNIYDRPDRLPRTADLPRGQRARGPEGENP